MMKNNVKRSAPSKEYPIVTFITQFVTTRRNRTSVIRWIHVSRDNESALTGGKNSTGSRYRAVLAPEIRGQVHVSLGTHAPVPEFYPSFDEDFRFNVGRSPSS
jgi:hypothetical protein